MCLAYSFHSTLDLNRQSPSKDSQPQSPQGSANGPSLESSSMIPSTSANANQETHAFTLTQSNSASMPEQIKLD